ncbi:MAG: hypothetical protein ABR549_15615 [Mycobacteriales bacterium]
MTAAYRCQICGAHPRWSLTRVGDAVRSWACAEHLSAVCEQLQRGVARVTELVVRHAHPAHPDEAR